MSGKKFVRIIDSKGLNIEPGDYDLVTVPCNVKNLSDDSYAADFIEGIEAIGDFGDEESGFCPIWFLEDNNVTFVIL